MYKVYTCILHPIDPTCTLGYAHFCCLSNKVLHVIVYSHLKGDRNWRQRCSRSDLNMWHTRACSDSQDGDDEVHCIPERCIAVILCKHLFFNVYELSSTFTWACTFWTIKLRFSNVLCPWKDHCCGTFRLVNLLPTLDNIPMDGLQQRQNNELNPSNPFHLLVKNYTVRG